jgi:hypothetical protein
MSTGTCILELTRMIRQANGPCPAMDHGAGGGRHVELANGGSWKRSSGCSVQRRARTPCNPSFAHGRRTQGSGADDRARAAGLRMTRLQSCITESRQGAQAGDTHLTQQHERSHVAGELGPPIPCLSALRVSHRQRQGCWMDGSHWVEVRQPGGRVASWSAGQGAARARTGRESQLFLCEFF